MSDHWPGRHRAVSELYIDPAIFSRYLPRLFPDRRNFYFVSFSPIAAVGFKQIETTTAIKGGQMLITLVKVPVLFVTLAIWAAVGFITWVPLLFRTTASFSATIVYSMLTGEGRNSLGEPLIYASQFYVLGFKRIIEALFAEELFHDQVPTISLTGLVHFLFSVIWTCLFWWITLPLLGLFL